jgi:hypothetical protein
MKGVSTMAEEQDGGQLSPDGTDDGGALSTEAESTEPTMAEVLKEMQEVKRQLQITQGDATKTRTQTERQLIELQGQLLTALQTGQQRPSQQPSIEDYARNMGLDPDDPAHIAIAKRDMQREQEMAEIRGHVKRTKLSEDQQIAWNATTAGLKEVAEIAGVSFETDILPHLNPTDANTSYWEGLAAIKRMAGAKKGQSNGNSNADTSQRVADILTRAGISETGQRVGRTATNQTPQDVINRVARGERVSNADLQAALNKL